MNRDDVDNRLVQAAGGGAAERSQMIDRVTDQGPSGTRDLLNEEIARDWDYLRNWDRVSSSLEAIDAVELEVRMTAKWSGIDKDLVEASAANDARRDPSMPPSIMTAREALNAYAERAPTALSGSPEGARAPDDPAAGMNRHLNTELQRDLGSRVFDAYAYGYGARLRAGNEWLAADPAGRTVIEANTLAGKVEAYTALDRVNETVSAEVDSEEQFRDPDTFALRFVSGRLDEALVDAASLAGRWEGTDPVIDQQLHILHVGTLGLDAAPQLGAIDIREVRFRYSDQTLRGGEAGLVGMTRAQNERAVGALVSAANTAANDALDSVRNVLQAQRGSGRATSAGERRYEPPSAGVSAELDR